jgi:hypothetical protein
VSHPDVSTIDRAGTAVSLACAVHCAAVPLLIGVLPLVGLQFLAHGAVEWALLFVATVLAIASCCWGVRRHGRRRVAFAFASALLLLIGGRFVVDSAHEWIPMVAGGVLLAASHVLNHRLCRACARCEGDEHGAA